MPTHSNSNRLFFYSQVENMVHEIYIFMYTDNKYERLQSKKYIFLHKVIRTYNSEY